MLPENVFLLVGTATTLVKILVDAVRIGIPDRPSWISPVLAIGFGPLVVFLVMVGNGVVISQVMIAQSVIAGVLAGGTAIGVTEAQRRSN